MNEQQFWKIIGVVKQEAGADVDARPTILLQHLVLLAPDDIQRFQQRYEALLLEANSWNLWAAAYVMNDGCSDDGFKYFRDWLISEGEQTYKDGVAKPDSLASLAKRDNFQLEAFGYAALKAYREKGAGELERDFAVEFAVTSGEEWMDEDLPTTLPLLTEKYRNDEES
nr:DUF4240 domain-containing protein [uncultured Duganella sp.]